jgi:hypothetical protein
MELTPVVSSNMAAVGYDAIQNVLVVQFKGNEKQYPYHGVSPELHAEMMAAPSIGSFFARNIKGRFPNEPLPKESGNQ